ncbi:MAG: hypothetical protein GWO26_30710 [Phycisphaerae bacterium]|nr:hypothetical protein [Phycisphaerae bacterium]
MRIPDFKNIPAWARWLAQDANGAWWAFEHEPNEGATSWYENEVGRYQLVCKEPPNTEWRNSLMKITR